MFGDKDVLQDKSFKTKGSSQRKNKQRKRVHVDDTPFRNLGVPVPTSRESAEVLSMSVLEDQKLALEVGFFKIDLTRFLMFGVRSSISTP